jgi:hypothetical protein
LCQSERISDNHYNANRWSALFPYTAENNNANSEIPREHTGTEQKDIEDKKTLSPSSGKRVMQ